MKLHSSRELKFKGSGVRVIYRITGGTEGDLEIVMILGVGDRDEDKAFKDASERLAEFFKNVED